MGLLALIVVLVGGWYFLTRNSTSPAQIDEAAIHQVVTDFGAQLQKVSLLASSTQVAAEVQAYYAPYLSQDLLNSWKQNPTLAFGRQTSSPWPDRIEIQSITPQNGGLYRVDAHIIEVANAASNTQQAVALDPIVLMLANQNGVWQIVSAALASSTPL